MKWKGRQGSRNVDDRRGGGGNTRGRRRGKRAGGLGIVGVIVVIVFSLITGQNPLNFMGNTGTTNTAQQSSQQAKPKSAGQNEQLAQFSKVVLKDTEDVWEKLFREQLNKTYKKPTMVIFNG